MSGLSRVLAPLAGGAGIAVWWVHSSLPPGTAAGDPAALLGATLKHPAFLAALAVAGASLAVAAESLARRGARRRRRRRELRSALLPAVAGPGVVLAAAPIDAMAASCLAPALLAFGSSLGVLAATRRLVAWRREGRPGPTSAAGVEAADVEATGVEAASAPVTGGLATSEAATEATASGSAGDERHRWGVVLAVVLASLVLLPGWPGPAGDEPHYLIVAHSLWFDGELDVADEYAAGAYRSFHPALLSPHTKPGKLPGSRYSMHGLGLPLLLLPGYALGRTWAPGLAVALPRGTLALLYGAFAWLLFGLIEAIVGRRAALWGTLAAVLLPPLIVAPLYLFPEVPAMLLGCGVFAAARRQRRATAALAAALGLAALPWLGVKYVPMATVLAVFGAWRAVRRRRWASALLYPGGLAAGLAGHTLLTWLLYGSLSPMSVYLGSPAAGAPPPALGALWGAYLASWPSAAATAIGYLIDQKEGLLAYGPHFLLAVLGVPWLWRRRRSDLLALAAIGAAHVGPYALSQQLGGQGPPVRPLMAVTWVLAPALGVALTLPAAGRAVAALRGGLLALAAMLGLAYAATPELLPHDYPVKASRLLRAYAPYDAGWWRAFPQWVNVEEPHWWVAGVWLLVVVAASALLMWLGRRLPGGGAGALAGGPGGGGVGPVALLRQRPAAAGEGDAVESEDGPPETQGGGPWEAPTPELGAGLAAATIVVAVACGAAATLRLLVPVTDLHRPVVLDIGVTAWVEEELPEVAWAEPGGIWVRPGRSVTLVLSWPKAIDRVDLEVGALVPVRVEVELQGDRLSGRAGPGAPLRGQLVPAPGRRFAGRTTYLCRVTADAGAIPAELEHSADERLLGAFVRVLRSSTSSTGRSAAATGPPASAVDTRRQTRVRGRQARGGR